MLWYQVYYDRDSIGDHTGAGDEAGLLPPLVLGFGEGGRLSQFVSEKI